MRTSWLGAMVLFLGLGGGADAQKEDVVFGKKASEWVQILREHKELRFRRASLIALEAIGPQVQGVTPALLEALERDSEPQIRREIALLLGRIGTEAKGTAPVLAEVMQKDASDLVREAAAQALAGKLNEQAQDHVTALTAALKDKHAGTRTAAAEALNNMGEAAKPALPALTAMARNTEELRHPRLYAIRVLSRWGKDAPETAQTLVDIVNDTKAETDVRSAAAEGLGHMACDTKECVAALSEALKEKGPRLAAAVALGKIGVKAQAAWPAVKALLPDPDTAFRYQLIRTTGALARINTDALDALAERAEKDGVPENRLAAVQELGELGPAAERAAPVLSRLATQDARASVREAAESALKKIKG